MTTRLRDGVRRSVPIAIAVFSFGISFGLLARSVGMGRVAPIVMSATTFAGSAQFAVASILDAGGTAAAAILAAVLLNVRYAPISISVGDLFGGAAPKRLVQSQLIVDESWALSSRGEGRFDRSVLLGAGLLVYSSWVAGTALGVLGGACSATRRGSGSTPRSQRSSWRCSSRSSGIGALSPPHLRQR
jgi:4-azaleucine resistance transporter AzlC